MTELLARDETLRRVIEAASAAPSFHHSQPWQFTLVEDELLEMRADEDHAHWAADRRSRALYLSCGAALFNLRIAIRMSGFNPLVCLLPQPGAKPLVLAAVRAEPGRPPSLPERELYGAIWRRHTDHEPYAADPIPGTVQSALAQAAAFEFTTLRSLDARQAADVLILAARAGTVPRQAGGFEPYPHLTVLTTAGDEPADWLRAGQALQRILLLATVHDLSASFLYQPTELPDVHEEAVPRWPWRENPQMIIRLGYGHAVADTSRKPPEEVLARSGGTSG